MDTTLTIRLDKAQIKALSDRAKAVGKTRSELVRELIDRAVMGESFGERVGHLRGRIALPRTGSDWRAELRARNWR